jgi:hypothetical protein
MDIQFTANRMKHLDKYGICVLDQSYSHTFIFAEQKVVIDMIISIKKIHRFMFCCIG